MMTFLPKQKVTLAALAHRIKVWSLGAAAPRHGQALLLSVLVMGLVLFLPNHYPYVKVASLILAPIVAWRLVMKMSTASSSHADQLDKLLAVYEPVDPDAFRELQEAAKAAGELQLEMAKIWLGKESEACLAARGVFPVPNVLRFVERKV